ncbi:MAG TPA: hypothetical protein VFL77_04960 [Solirubrobacterales bacterium]|nr:hypothetical protein [Solirubrobacterales bacterium]
MSLLPGRGRVLACIIPLLLVGLPVTAAAASSGYDQISSGHTTIALSPSFVRLLSAHRVSIQVGEGARRRGARILLPAAGGEFDPGLGTGTLESAGTIVFAAGRRKVVLRRVVFKAKRSPLYAKVGGGQLKIASAGQLRSKRVGFGVSFTAGRLRLTAKAASRLDKKLRLGRALAAGQPLGTLTAAAQPSTVHLLQQGRLSLAIDPAFFAKLNGLFVSLNPIAPAELGPGPTLSFPVGPESTLAPDAAAGTVKLGGSVELLQLGSAQVFWREVWLEAGAASLAAEADVEPSPPQAGKQPQGPLLALPPGASVSSDPSRRTIAISGQSATLTAATAESLNAAFAPGTSTFAAGETIGTLSLAVQAE